MAAWLLSLTLLDFQRNVELVLVGVAHRHHPAWLFPCQLLCRHYFCGNTHWGYWRTGSTSVYTLALGAVDVGICNRGCLSLSCISPCPPAGVFTSAKESSEAEMEERLCGGVVQTVWVCACLSGEGSGSLVWHTWLPSLIGDYFGLPRHPPKTETLLCVFFYYYLPQSSLPLAGHLSDTELFPLFLFSPK